MKRLLLTELKAWLGATRRQALILRGARQVGKTWLIRELASAADRDLLELNFERDPGLASMFESADPKQVLADMELRLDRTIDPGRSILFLDEIQAAAPVLASLRWFTEEMPELPVIATGSLLEFALAEYQLSIPVGRVTYRSLEPMNFQEYLVAHGQNRLASRLSSWSPGEELASTAHERASQWYERYQMIGGMPAVVRADVEDGHAGRCRNLQIDLMAAFRDDFTKYVGKMDPAILDSTLLSVAAQLGGKFVYSKVGEGVKQHQVKRSLELLGHARVATIAPHSVASGIPLGGEIKARSRKVLFLDIGLAHALLKTPANAAFPKIANLAATVRGKLAEQLSGQQLRVLHPGRGAEPSLHFWQRDGGRAGEIDFLVEIEQRIIPIELKSGAAGSMKSLHQFMHDKALGFAVRIDTNPPSIQTVEVKTTRGDRANYRLLNLPGYLIWRLADLCADCVG